LPKSESKILPKLVRPHPDPFFARNFLDLLDAAELPKRRVARLTRRQAGGNVPLGQEINMLLNSSAISASRAFLWTKPSKRQNQARIRMIRGVSLQWLSGEVDRALRRSMANNGSVAATAKHRATERTTHQLKWTQVSKDAVHSVRSPLGLD
jgi:hypothetical protein